jgi:DinB superfamily
VKSREADLLLALLDEAYEKKAWQGANLRGSLRGVTPTQAAWRPAPDAHNIWELAVHASYWKYAVWRMLTGEPRGSFGEKGSNWFPRPAAATEGAWRVDLARLDAMHRKLRRAVASLPASRLSRKPRGSQHSISKLVYGAASHDVYHTGQIQLLKRLWKSRKRRPL